MNWKAVKKKCRTCWMKTEITSGNLIPRNWLESTVVDRWSLSSLSFFISPCLHDPRAMTAGVSNSWKGQPGQTGKRVEARWRAIPSAWLSRLGVGHTASKLKLYQVYCNFVLQSVALQLLCNPAFTFAQSSCRKESARVILSKCCLQNWLSIVQCAKVSS